MFVALRSLERQDILRLKGVTIPFAPSAVRWPGFDLPRERRAPPWTGKVRRDMALTDEAIAQIRTLIQSGQLRPGSRLPPEQQLAAELGLSRSSMREAVKALETARVLDVRRGDGTYVTSLAPNLLLQGLGFAIELLQDHNLLEVMEVRRMLERIATAAAASRIT